MVVNRSVVDSSSVTRFALRQLGHGVHSGGEESRVHGGFTTIGSVTQTRVVIGPVGPGTSEHLLREKVREAF